MRDAVDSIPSAIKENPFHLNPKAIWLPRIEDRERGGEVQRVAIGNDVRENSPACVRLEAGNGSAACP